MTDIKAPLALCQIYMYSLLIKDKKKSIFAADFSQSIVFTHVFCLHKTFCVNAVKIIDLFFVILLIIEYKKENI